MATIIPSSGGGGASTGQWTEVATTVHSGAAVQSLSLDGSYDADTDEEYWLRIWLLLATGTSHHIRLELRGNTTNANYGAEFESNFTRQIATANTMQLTVAFSGSNRFRYDLWVSKRSSERTVGSGLGLVSTTSALNDNRGTVLDGATTNWTSIAIGSSAAGRILADSEVQVLKRAA